MRLLNLVGVTIMAAIIFAAPAIAAEKTKMAEHHPIETYVQSMGPLVQDIDALMAMVKDIAEILKKTPNVPDKEKLESMVKQLDVAIVAHKEAWKNFEKERAELRERGHFIREGGSEKH